MICFPQEYEREVTLAVSFHSWEPGARAGGKDWPSLIQGVCVGLMSQCSVQQARGAMDGSRGSEVPEVSREETS